MVAYCQRRISIYLQPKAVCYPCLFRLCYDGRSQIYGALHPDTSNTEYGISRTACTVLDAGNAEAFAVNAGYFDTEGPQASCHAYSAVRYGSPRQ